MSYNGKIISKITYSSKNKHFKGLEDIADNLESYIDEVDGELDMDALMDAEVLANELAYAYTGFLADNHLASKVKPASITINAIKDGYNVVMYGKDVLFHEFGTGMPGKESDYPKKILVKYNWKYLVGTKIIQNYTFVNSPILDTYGGIPKWYVGMVEKGVISKDDFVWMSPYGPTQGIPAGRFWYDLISDYTEDLSNPKGIERKLNKSSLKLKVKNKLTTGKWK